VLIFIEEDDGGNVKLSTLFAKYHFQTNFIQSQVTKRYLSNKKEISSDHIEYYSYCEYDFFHKIYYPQIQYQSAWNLLSERNYHIKIWKNKKRFYRFYENRATDGYIKPFLKYLYNLADSLLCQIHNRVIFDPKEILIFEYQEKDFRNRKNFDYLRCHYAPSLALGNGFSSKLRNFANRNVYYIRNIKPVIWGDFTYSKYLKYMGMNGLLQEKITNLYFRSTKTRALIGIDDPSFGRPFIAGCRGAGLITIGVQHGLYGSENIGYSDLEKSIHWYDYLICWDEFCKNIFLENNKNFKEERVLTGTDFFFSGDTKGKVKDTIFLIGEENINSSLLDDIISMMLKDNWKVVCLKKGGSAGSNPDIIYVSNIYDVPFEECAAIIGAKSSLVYQLHRLNLPTFIVPCGEGYLSELCSYLDIKELTYYLRIDFQEMLYQFQPLSGANDETLFSENVSKIFRKENLILAN